MAKRLAVLAGMVAGLLWAVAIVVLPLQADLPFVMAGVALPLAFLAPGAVLALIIASMAARRFFDPDLIDGEPPVPQSGAQRDQAVLANSVEQVALALLIWPFVANTLGGAVIVVMGLGFALARLVFWLGYHVSPPLRAVGFAATFYPTVVAAIWSVLAWAGYVAA